jgi:hypothetical protein
MGHRTLRKVQGEIPRYLACIIHVCVFVHTYRLFFKDADEHMFVLDDWEQDTADLINSIDSDAEEELKGRLCVYACLYTLIYAKTSMHIRARYGRPSVLPA